MGSILRHVSRSISSYAFPRVRCGLGCHGAVRETAQGRLAHAPCLTYHSALPVNLQLHTGALAGTDRDSEVIAYTPVSIHELPAWSWNVHDGDRRQFMPICALVYPGVVALAGLPVNFTALRHRADAFSMLFLSAYVFVTAKLTNLPQHLHAANLLRYILCRQWPIPR